MKSKIESSEKCAETPTQKTVLSQKTLLTVIFFIASVIFWEMAVHLIVFGSISTNILYTIFFSVSIGFLLFLLGSLFGRKLNLAVGWLELSILYVYFCVQLVYHRIFGSFLSISLIGLGGDAITSFWKETIYCIWQNKLWLLLLAVPLIVYSVLINLYSLEMNGRMPRIKIIFVCIAIMLHLGCLLSLRIGGTDYYTAYNTYYSNDADTDRSAEILGIITTSRLELQHLLFGSGEDDALSDVDIPTVSISPTATAAPDVTPEVTEEPIDNSPNVIEEIDFNYLNSLTDDSDLLEVNEYFAGCSGTNKNEYTGLFEGNNLIVICAESFSPYLISEELTPTLYQLSTEGIIFENFYNCFPNVTTNGEYSLCMGLFPDMSRSKSESSFYASKDNYLPFCLGNMFTSAGVDSYAYHNFLGSYYHRDLTYPNIGYSFQSAGNGMSFTDAWPASDLEMMEQSVDDYVENPFNVYYMTFSGHYQYNFETNPICILNQADVADLDYSTAVKAYLSCNLELEYAMEYLMNRLEETGQADNTVIVLTADHYPYGLTSGEYNELAGKEIDTTFGKYKNSFICWCGGLEEPIVVDDYCCTVDILPTLLNLFGLEYDSRLLVGTDVFSASDHIAILSNQSFITDYVMFDSTTNTATWLCPEEDVPDGYLDALIQTVKNRFTISTDILDNDYYDFVFSSLKN